MPAPDERQRTNPDDLERFKRLLDIPIRTSEDADRDIWRKFGEKVKPEPEREPVPA